MGGLGQGSLWESALHCSWPQVEEAISQTSQTLQLLIEHDPVTQRLDHLRLGAQLSAHMQNAGQSHTLSPLDTKENLEGTLRRRSLRCCLPPWLCSVPGPPSEALLAFGNQQHQEGNQLVGNRL